LRFTSESFRKERCEPQSETVQLELGDSVIFLSDGFCEAQNSVGEFSGMESVLEACAQIPSLSGDTLVLRQHIAESARDIFQAIVAGMMVRDGEAYLPGAICTTVNEPAEKKALLEHSRSFATQAIEQKRLLDFHSCLFVSIRG